MNDILTFKKMITPLIIQIIFWLGVVGIFFAAYNELNFAAGTFAFLGGIVIWRVYCEIMIVLFKINENVQELSNSKE